MTVASSFRYPRSFESILARNGSGLSDEQDRERILAEHGKRGKPEIMRFKGLGEMMPKDLWETTLNPPQDGF